MSISTTPRVTIDPAVPEFLRKNDAEASFQTICELIRECFPEVLALEVELQEDHDERGWWRVHILFTLPAECSADRAWVQNRLLLDRLMERVPFTPLPLFIAIYTFAAE